MNFPIYATQGIPKEYVKRFLGLNRRKYAYSGECEDCADVDGAEYPVLRSVPAAEAVLTTNKEITKLLPPDGDEFKLRGILDGEISGFGEFELTGESPDLRCKDILKSADGIVTIPNLWAYNLSDGSVSKRDDYTYRQTLASRDNIRSDGPEYYFMISEGAGDKVKIGMRISYIKVNDFCWEAEDDYFYISEKRTVAFRSGVNESSEDFFCLCVKYYKKNEEGEFTESINEDLSALAADKSAKYSKQIEADYVIITAEEEISKACIWLNRLWGCSADGRYIRCSKPGELNILTDFAHGAASAWSCEVGSDGAFTGIITFNNAIFAFKEDWVHVVYGTVPSNFSMEKSFYGCGAIDGRSLVSVGSALYWLGNGGIYRYSGGAPKIISDNLNRKYTGCVSFADDRRIWFYLTAEGGDTELLCYDTERSLWHKYGLTGIIGGFLYNGKPYAYTEHELYMLYGGEYGEWFFESVLEYDDNMADISPVEFYVRALMSEGSTFKIEFKSTSDSDWEVLGGYSADKEEMIKEKLAARRRCGCAYRWRISGTGEVYIYEIEKTVPADGKSFKKG